ncbi:MAG TPA: MarR family transcriptional regulator [Nitrososphaerales archaeon]|nr:MarR family transcriptional regulator [Nitrososphaerales archaeon]
MPLPADPEFAMWQNVRSIYRTALKRLNARLKLVGLTYPQYSVLLAIGQNGPMQMNRLSEFMLVAPANVTGLVDRLEKRGYVRRKRSAEDRRLYLIELTQRGEETYKSVSSRFISYARSLSAGLSASELDAGLRALERMRTRVNELPEL